MFVFSLARLYVKWICFCGSNLASAILKLESVGLHVYIYMYVEPFYCKVIILKGITHWII